MLDVLGIFVAILPAVIGVALVWLIGGLPGRVAKRTEHPDAAAIRVGGWATLLLGVVGYPWVLMWAYRKPRGEKGDSSLEERVAELERRLASGQAAEQGGSSE